MGDKRRHDVKRTRPMFWVSEAQAERWAYRDQRNRDISKAVQNFYVGYECRHERLPGDPKPHDCACWGHWEVDVTAADEIVAAIVSLTERVDSMLERLERIDDKVNRVDTNVTAVGYQVSKAGDNGR